MRKAAVVAFAMLATLSAHGAITFESYASQPADNASQGDSAAVAITPGTCAANDLALLLSSMDSGDGSSNVIINDGGQTWTQFANLNSGTGNEMEGWYAVFNGTWSANPSVESHQHLGNAGLTVELLCFQGRDTLVGRRRGIARLVRGTWRCVRHDGRLRPRRDLGRERDLGRLLEGEWRDHIHAADGRLDEPE